MGKRHELHPDARLAAITAAVEETRGEEGLPDGWRWPLGWYVRLWEPNGTFVTRTLPESASYLDAKEVARQDLATGRYEKAWISLRTGFEKAGAR